VQANFRIDEGLLTRRDSVDFQLQTDIDTTTH